MTDHLKTIRESINDFMTGNMAALDDLFAALDALEQAMKTPVAWIEHHQGSIGYSPYPDAARQLPDGVRFDLYTAAPPAQQAQAEAALDRMAENERELGIQMQAEAVPQGRPTNEMIEAGRKAAASHGPLLGNGQSLWHIFRDMYAAAPQPKGGE